MQCIDHSEYRHYAVRLSLLVYFLFREVPELRDVLIRKAHKLCCLQGLHVIDPLPQQSLHLDDVFESFKEDIRDHGDLVYLFDADAPSQKLGYGVHVVIPEFGNVIHELVAAHAVKLLKVQVAYARLERPYGLEEALREVGAYSHDLSGRLHLRTQHIRGIAEFVERESRELGNDVVEARLS